ncbi:MULTISPECIES: putative virulence factor [unclassified Brenneria]|uniref:putative virulence factor n=1 Tax=unclassified Brenneria TaxID=2634434 RepID=UPI0018F1067C|nr:virulence factor SrfC family protein [Brenneria sp. L3-3C-1]MBJ7220816.1 virulence factor [Brenneria sp. L3-3C-1]MEE3642056.1 virulence factor SrfC family protein [Brenneria sp. L3_3C_1]
MKPLTPKQLSSRLNSQLQAVAQGVDRAIDWIETTRQNAPRLDMEADRLMVKLRRHRNKANHLSDVSLKEIAIGFFGLSQAGKSYLISALAGGENGKLETSLEGQQLDFLTHINPENQSAALVTRFSRQAGVKNKSFPVQLLLLSEADIGKIIANAFLHDFNQEKAFEELDEQYIGEHLKTLLMHRQPEPVAGMSADEVVALWDYLARHDAKRQKQLETHFWPVAIDLAPYLSVDDRAQLFSLLWGDHQALTAAYRHFAHTLQHLSGAHKVLAPIRVLVDESLRPVNGIINGATLAHLNTVNDTGISVRPVLNGRAGKAAELSQAELTMLAAELLIPLHSPTREALFEQVDILDFPGFGDTPDSADPQQTEMDIHPLAHTLLRAKRAYLLERYTDNQEMNVLMVCTAAGKRADVKIVGKALDYWVKQTQGENTQVRSRRKPGLIWAVTRFDRRITHGQNHDAAVQRYVGNPGDAWGTMLAMDKRGVSRMAAWLGTEVHREVKLGRISEQLSEIQRELGDNLLGNWYQPAGTDDPAQKQRIAETLLKALQTRTGVHGELLERLLPSRDELRRLYLKQQVQPGYHHHQESDEPGASLTGSEPFGIGIDIDLFADDPIDVDQPASPLQARDHGYEAEYAHLVYRYWINHLRSLPENAPLVELLGVAKATIELLAEELITASIRLNIEDTLVSMLADTEQLSVHRESKADRQVSRVLTVLGDFVAWLGFQQMDEALRPASRINRGHKIFAKPVKQAVNWGASQRLTRLAPTPINNTAFYIYDWLVGLNEMIVQNAGYAAGREVSAEQREQLGAILNVIKPAEK